MQDLIEIDNDNILTVFSNDDGLAPIIGKIKNEVDSFNHDLSTKSGRAATASLSAKVSKCKVKLDDLGKGLVSDWKKKASVVDKNRKQMRDTLDLLRDEARKPLTEWENSEKERINLIKNNILNIENLAGQPFLDSIAIVSNIEQLLSIEIDDSYSEFKDEAEDAKKESTKKAYENLKVATDRENKEKEDLRIRQEHERLLKENEELKSKQEEHERLIEEEKQIKLMASLRPAIENADNRIGEEEIKKEEENYSININEGPPSINYKTLEGDTISKYLFINERNLEKMSIDKKYYENQDEAGIYIKINNISDFFSYKEVDEIIEVLAKMIGKNI